MELASIYEEKKKLAQQRQVELSGAMETVRSALKTAQSMPSLSDVTLPRLGPAKK
jgi:hypothetical protein